MVGAGIDNRTSQLVMKASAAHVCLLFIALSPLDSPPVPASLPAMPLLIV
jgi:hypothetical protein